ncbi:hypothetical protein F5Y00DRAFT_250099 [Daldinia vernicosa]|uniref:uncharacterized protein n=1 Tax=Daldinia vernicosa TaxID=114800 RepID=UPI0020079FB6|nr:uncharacterized protein F5Y00DRAFT_250099 [Daldinia vernicosa]KAI0843859.1 hypothetical protein F5Y00DRAFT_250099 [Daldinia vernicosa]
MVFLFFFSSLSGARWINLYNYDRPFEASTSTMYALHKLSSSSMSYIRESGMGPAPAGILPSARSILVTPPSSAIKTAT